MQIYDLYLIDCETEAVLGVECGVNVIAALHWWLEWQEDARNCLPLMVPSGHDVSKFLGWSLVKVSNA